ncbi:hypothetical protein GCM10010172_77140 [Paractinoplanes ferrugineus]|uniref:Uncharacterized protein n=1 Tax=Paractinoplanes ferrugineus TaxID=113564 RepID=A0A919J2L8_9ACTN|nr:DUF6114 domain-containing protein [Actinoplanes ferrugineus]GIE12788.1 hypothetical protein Afe05nite_46280 [Actinoplanes ferrugineus]
MRQRSAFWHWRHARPFWGGLFVFLSGAEIFLTVWAPLPVIVHVGMQGFIGYLLPILIAVLGVLLLLNPAQHLFYSLVAAVLTLASWLTSNLGGFIVGLVLGVVGSALAFAWSPDKYRAEYPAEPEPEPEAEPPAENTAGPGLDDLMAGDQADASPGVQPDTSQSRPRHSRPSPGVLSGE